MKPDRILFTISIIDSLYYELNDPDSWDNILIFGLIIDRSRIRSQFFSKHSCIATIDL